jgi:hypothetical protein
VWGLIIRLESVNLVNNLGVSKSTHICRKQNLINKLDLSKGILIFLKRPNTLICLICALTNVILPSQEKNNYISNKHTLCTIVSIKTFKKLGTNY